MQKLYVIEPLTLILIIHTANLYWMKFMEKGGRGKMCALLIPYSKTHPCGVAEVAMNLNQTSQQKQTTICCILTFL